MPATAEAPVAIPAWNDGKPRSRRYLFRVNANCPKEGAFNGTCLVFYDEAKSKGDEFFLTINPTRKRKGGKVELIHTKLPTWADVVEEYELPKDPQPLRRILPGAAPTLTR